MAPSLGPNTIQPVAALSSTASASSSIYSRLDAHTLLPLDSSVALIGCVGPSCYNTDDGSAPVGSQQAVFGRRFDVHTSFIQPAEHIFTDLGAGDELRLHHYSWQLGRECFDPPSMTWRSIANGDWDAQLIVPAARHIVANVARPIVLALCNEMMSKDFVQACGGFRRYDPECPAAYKAMYWHVQKVFAREGVTHKQVIWSWNTMNVLLDAPARNESKSRNLAYGEEDWDEWYVGDENVSWVGINAFSADVRGNNWVTLRQLYEPFYRWVAPKSVQPFFHAFGTAEWYGDHTRKKAWYEELPSLLGPNGAFPRVRVATIYPEMKYDPQTSEESIAGFKWAANSPVFDAFGYANTTARTCCGGPSAAAEPCCWEEAAGEATTTMSTGNSGAPQIAPPILCDKRMVKLSLVANGDVSEYADTTFLQEAIATLAGVSKGAVEIYVVPASVDITVYIAIDDGSTIEAVSETLQQSLGSATAASSVLGIDILSAPAIDVMPDWAPPDFEIPEFNASKALGIP